jgi:hypothetical protein
MIDQRIEELMWLEIEGTISGEDREKLHRYLETDGEARGYFNDIVRMATLFGRSGEVEPPAELRARILRALDKAAAPRVEKRGMGAWFAPRPFWRLAAAGAVGVIIGIVGYHLVLKANEASKPIDIKQLYGSIAPGDETLQGSVIDIDLPGAKAKLAVRRNDARVFSDLTVDSAAEVDIVLQYAGTPIEFAGGKLSRTPSNEVAISDHEVRVRNRGQGTYHIMFSLHDDPQSPVRVRIQSGGNVLFEEDVPPIRLPDKG